jgi:hypothetical protein
MIVEYTRDGQTYQLDTTTLGAEALAYLINYGFRQSMQDSIAGRAKAVREEMETFTRADGTTFTQEQINKAVADDIAGTLGKRLDAIKSGAITQRAAGEPRDPFAAMCRRIAVEILRATAKAKGKKLPKADSDEYEALVGKVLAAKAEDIETEAKRRMAAAESVDIDL